MAVNVTFIIGNGLDLSLGLKTSYSDFYKYVIENNLLGDNKIYKKVADRPDNWSDFETALGKYTYYIEDFAEDKREDESIEFHRELDVIRDDLADYLQSQEASIENLPDKFTLATDEDGLYGDLNPGQKSVLNRLLYNKPVYLNFVSLNYTSTLEKILSGDVLFSSRGYHIQQPQHLHGSFDLYMTLGVSEKTQLFDGMSAREKNDLIKPRLIDSSNDGRIDSFQKTLSSSSLVILFGTSLGKTDSYIWQDVMRWLRQQDDRYVLIHKYDPEYTTRVKRSARAENTYTNIVQDQLLSYIAISDQEKQSLKRRIFVVHNTDKLFVPKK